MVDDASGAGATRALGAACSALRKPDPDLHSPDDARRWPTAGLARRRRTANIEKTGTRVHTLLPRIWPGGPPSRMPGPRCGRGQRCDGVSIIFAIRILTPVVLMIRRLSAKVAHGDALGARAGRPISEIAGAEDSEGDEG